MDIRHFLLNQSGFGFIILSENRIRTGVRFDYFKQILINGFMYLHQSKVNFLVCSQTLKLNG